MSRIAERPNQFLSPYLSGVGLAGVFARYVVARRPDASSLAAGKGNRVTGVAISGAPVGLYEAAMCWIFADDAETFEELLTEIDRAGLTPLNFPLRFAHLVGRDRPTSVDRLYAIPNPSRASLPESTDVEALDRRRLSDVVIHPELVPFIGELEEIPDDFPYFGIVRDGTLVALAESVVRDDESATIQQVVTVSSERGQGLGKAVVAEVARDILTRGQAPTYLVSENNLASVALVESLGLVVDSTWGYAE